MAVPKISFICSSYNHEKYVGYFLESLLSQTVSDWELVIIDDNSTDKTAAAIKRIDDVRIRFFQHSYNKGLTFGVSEGCGLASAAIVAWMASDDALLPDYVERVLREFDDPQISAVYTPLQCMDEESRLVEKMIWLNPKTPAETFFSEAFLHGNPLTSPGMAFRKSALSPYLPLDIGMIQYADWQMHFFLLFEHTIKILEYPVVLYRISAGSLSARSPDAIMREDLETQKLMNTVVDLIGQDIDAFQKYFGNHPLVVDQDIRPETVPYWLGRLALTSSIFAKQKWGVQTIMNFISTSENMELLNNLYDFTYGHYMHLCNITITDIMNPIWKKEAKLKKYRRRSKILMFLAVTLGGSLAVSLLLRVL